MSTDISGIYAATLTPLHDDETPDTKAIPTLVEHLLRAGIHGLFAVGTHGEAYALNPEERGRVTHAFVRAAAGRVPVMAGIGAPTTRQALENLRLVEAAGADAVSVVTPYYVAPSQKEIYEHFRAIAEASSLPVVLYNLPGRTHVAIEPPTMARLAKIDQIVGVKDSSGDLNNTIDFIRLTPYDFSVMNGNDGLIFSTLMANGAGAVSAGANIIPAIMVGIYENIKNDDIEEARALQMKAIALRRCFSLSTVPDPIKEAARLIGLPVGPTARPCGPISPEARETLIAVLQKLGLDMTS
ncbi:MAG: 4-hydroxy-tetrahydrodipicolinate synthase [Armatimonadota bacterium]